MNELKPCPFCPDGKVRTFIGKREAGVLCSCGASVLLPYGTYVSEDEALCQCIKRWNTRHYPDEVQQAVERMKPKPLKKEWTMECRCGAQVARIQNYCSHCGQRLNILSKHFAKD